MDASEETLNELADKIKIDPDSLDTEFINQTNWYYHAATGYAMAVSLRDQAKSDLDTTEAELYLSFRNGTRDKPTEAQLKAMVEADDVRREYLALYTQAKQLADRWLALRDSFTQKGHALRELAELYKLNYFGERPLSATDRQEAENRVRTRTTGND
jgi:hypothetical protein